MIDSVVYDAGMLIGLANHQARARLQHTEVIKQTRPIVPAPVLAQVWRGDSVALARYLKDCRVFTAYAERDYKSIGRMLGKAVLPGKKRPDVIDALVAFTAAKHEPSAVITSDPADIAAYLNTLPKARAVVIPV